MKILVPIKRVIDYNVRIRVKADHSSVETTDVKMSMNPFDEIAVEEAIRLKEKNIATEVIVVTVGSREAQETLRSALALGADRGIHILTDLQIQPLGVAKALKAIAVKEAVQLIIMGKQAIDDDCNQTGQMVAGLLNWPQATFASKISFLENRIHITREIDGGLETIQTTLPVVITTDLRLNQPRYASLPNIMKAKQKPIDTLSSEELDIDFTPQQKILKVTEPEKRRAGIKVSSVAELLEKLKYEAKVI